MRQNWVSRTGCTKHYHVRFLQSSSSERHENAHFVPDIKRRRCVPHGISKRDVACHTEYQKETLRATRNIKKRRCVPYGISERDVPCHTDELGYLSLLCGASPTIRYSDQKTEGEKKTQNQTNLFKIKSLMSICFTFFPVSSTPVGVLSQGYTINRLERERQRQRETERRRQIQTDRQKQRDRDGTETQRDRDGTETQRHRDRDTETETERQGDRDRQRQKEREGRGEERGVERESARRSFLSTTRNSKIPSSIGRTLELI